MLVSVYTNVRGLRFHTQSCKSCLIFELLAYLLSVSGWVFKVIKNQDFLLTNITVTTFALSFRYENVHFS